MSSPFSRLNIKLTVGRFHEINISLSRKGGRAKGSLKTSQIVRQWGDFLKEIAIAPKNFESVLNGDLGSMTIFLILQN